MIERVRQRDRSKSISISQDMWDKIKQACGNNISVSSFIKLAVKKELEKRGIS